MKQCYIVTFDSQVFDHLVFTDYERARQRLADIRADDKSDAHLYELGTFELVGEQDVSDD
jgi:hypothetical protein